MTQTVTTVLAAGAIVIQVVLAVLLVLVVASRFSSGARRVLGELRATVAGSEMWIAWALAAIATLGSLYFSEVAHFVPCRLCWFQRIAMYPLAVVLLVAAIRRDRAGVYYAFALPVAGMLVAGYHLYIEAHPEAESAGWVRDLGRRAEALDEVLVAVSGVLRALVAIPEIDELPHAVLLGAGERRPGAGGGVRTDEAQQAQVELDLAGPHLGLDDLRQDVERVVAAVEALQVRELRERALRVRAAEHGPVLRDPGEHRLAVGHAGDLVTRARGPFVAQQAHGREPADREGRYARDRPQPDHPPAAGELRFASFGFSAFRLELGFLDGT